MSNFSYQTFIDVEMGKYNNNNKIIKKNYLNKEIIIINSNNDDNIESQHNNNIDNKENNTNNNKYDNDYNILKNNNNNNNNDYDYDSNDNNNSDNNNDDNNDNNNDDNDGNYYNLPLCSRCEICIEKNIKLIFSMLNFIFLFNFLMLLISVIICLVKINNSDLDILITSNFTNLLFFCSLVNYIKMTVFKPKLRRNIYFRYYDIIFCRETSIFSLNIIIFLAVTLIILNCFCISSIDFIFKSINSDNNNDNQIITYIEDNLISKIIIWYNLIFAIINVSRYYLIFIVMYAISIARRFIHN